MDLLLLVVLEHTVGVEHGSVLHFFYVGAGFGSLHRESGGGERARERNAAGGGGR